MSKAKLILLGVALVLLSAGIYFKVDIPAALDQLQVISNQLETLTAEEDAIEVE